jgi:hypothetical protein
VKCPINSAWKNLLPFQVILNAQQYRVCKHIVETFVEKQFSARGLLMDSICGESNVLCEYQRKGPDGKFMLIINQTNHSSEQLASPGI